MALIHLTREYRTRRMARFTAWMLAYGAALGVLERLGGGPPRLLWAIFWLAFVACLLYYLVRLGRFIRRRMLWRLRRRLIVTYLFIAVVPILLILLMVGLIVFLYSGQFAAFLVAWKIREHSEKLQELNRAVAHMGRMAEERTPEGMLGRIQGFCVPELAQHALSFPNSEVTLRLGRLTRAFRLDGSVVENPVSVPEWLKRDEFAGIVADQGQIALRALNRVRTPHGELVVIHTQPITPELLDHIGAGVGPVGVLIPEEPSASSRPADVGRDASQARYVQSGTIQSRSLRVPEATSVLDPIAYGTSTLEPTVWGGPSEVRVAQPVFVFVTSRIATLNREMLAPLGRFSRAYVIAFLAVGLVFLVIELVALVIGIRMTRSITRAVDNLYDATEKVKAGDLSYRIDQPARDQLSALGAAFDSMTASVERLLRESQEKSRLESELSIAREVQNQLFPQFVPHLPGLELLGVCKPARVVSGDYYDFLPLGESRVGLVLSDVAGKGISAALLMAAIQSSLRAQYTNRHWPGELDAAVPISTAEVVGRLNRQLYDSTPGEKYATFFYAVYDATSRKLIYTNAGHIPPVLFRRDGISRLDRGGTVVGLFSSVDYEQAEVQLEAGDLLLAFSDGLTEPENIFGEQFGEERLLEVARKALAASPDVLAEEIYRGVSDWTGSPELQDDMTLLVARATARGSEVSVVKDRGLQ